MRLVKIKYRRMGLRDNSPVFETGPIHPKDLHDELFKLKCMNCSDFQVDKGVSE